MAKKQADPIAAYIQGFPTDTQALLNSLRTLILTTAPNAEEKISYGMPAYKQNGMLLYFAAYKNHIGIYPGASGIQAVKDDITNYKCSKGTIQLPLDKPIPSKLIRKLIRLKLEINQQKLEARKRKSPQ